MSIKRMLIDATHPEETRVVVVNGKRLEDFDVEVESRRQLKGNIYLAKVTRVEPSLQAAFVDFGGNRHGFLAFNEIHPDYYQIPVADREALIAEQRQAEAEAEDSETNEDDADENPVQSIGGDDTDELGPHRPIGLRRQYKIQEVIKRRQILLVQVVKEERGNKGAALTTYISLPGRYCVLMPNTARGGGISRKISNAGDRRRLKTILNEFKIPEGVAVIVRTAGSKRSKAEIKRDYDYLMRLWNQVREITLESIAPCSVYEEGNLIKRTIRDLYSKDIEEVIVDGNDGYRTAKDFMKLLIPSHAKRVQPYKDTNERLFHRYQIENQLDSMHEPEVALKSGGYIVLSQTEALVAIDVNSGKATRERNIEETALRTNLEAADEISRQLRLRDLSGLIVIDFIDMEIHRNQVKVERQLKEAMKIDRARIQMGRISPFGLLELSRQRLRPSFMETSTTPCPHCDGTGALRSIESSALSVIRAIEEEGLRGRSVSITVHVATPIALYILNHKRSALAEIEERHGFAVTLTNDETLIAPEHRIERIKGVPLDGDVTDSTQDDENNTTQKDESTPKKRRRRRTRRRNRRSDEESGPVNDNELDEKLEYDDGALSTQSDETLTENASIKKRRRGRRGGRKRPRSRDQDPSNHLASNTEDVLSAEDAKTADPKVESPPVGEEETSSMKAPRRKYRRNANQKSPKISASDTLNSEKTKAQKLPSTRNYQKSKNKDQHSSPSTKENTDSKKIKEVPIDLGKPTTQTEQGINDIKSTPPSVNHGKTEVIVVDGEGQQSEDVPIRRGGWWRRS